MPPQPSEQLVPHVLEGDSLTDGPLPLPADLSDPAAPRTPEGHGSASSRRSPLTAGAGSQFDGTPRPPMMDQGQQTTPDKGKLSGPKRPRKRMPGEALLPPPREGKFSLVEVGLDRFKNGSRRNSSRMEKRPRRHQ